MRNLCVYYFIPLNFALRGLFTATAGLKDNRQASPKLLNFVQLSQHQQCISQLEELKAKQSTELINQESSNAALEAERAGLAALHEADMQKLQQQLSDLMMQNQEQQATHEHSFQAMRASLEAQFSCSREAALTAELAHSNAMSDLQTSLQTQIAELTSQLQVTLFWPSFPQHCCCVCLARHDASAIAIVSHQAYICQTVMRPTRRNCPFHGIHKSITSMTSI